jgi:hypothetical protein
MKMIALCKGFFDLLFADRKTSMEPYTDLQACTLCALFKILYGDVYI